MQFRQVGQSKANPILISKTDKGVVTNAVAKNMSIAIRHIWLQQLLAK